jgi:hypothetical protein
MKRPVATRPDTQAAAKAVQPVGIDHRMKVRREKKAGFSEGAGAVGGNVPPEGALSLASVMVTDNLMGLN